MYSADASQAHKTRDRCPATRWLPGSWCPLLFPARAHVCVPVIFTNGSPWHITFTIFAIMQTHFAQCITLSGFLNVRDALIETEIQTQ